MTTLTERIKNGSGEDRELDWEIHNHFWRHAPDYLPGKGSHPDYCTDLNAVFALVEREFPQVYYCIEGGAGLRDVPAQNRAMVQAELGVQCKEGWHNDRCRALLLALLEAKNARTNP